MTYKYFLSTLIGAFVHIDLVYSVSFDPYKLKQDYVKFCFVLFCFHKKGIVSLKFPLSSQPVLGDWKIDATVQVYFISIYTSRSFSLE